MNITDVVALAKAGFTAEQISKLSELTSALAPTPAPAPAPAPTPAAPAPAPNYFDSIMAKLQEVQNSVITNNLTGAGLTPPKQETADDILASIIAPRPPETNK